MYNGASLLAVRYCALGAGMIQTWAIVLRCNISFYVFLTGTAHTAGTLEMFNPVQPVCYVSGEVDWVRVVVCRLPTQLTGTTHLTGMDSGCSPLDLFALLCSIYCALFYFCILVAS